MLHQLRAFFTARRQISLRSLHRRSAAGGNSAKLKSHPPPPPPVPPRPPQKPEPFTIHGITWHDSYNWMSNFTDSVSMRHMDVYMEQEEKYSEAAMIAAGADRLERKLQIEMASRMSTDLCSPPIRWGPWLYYRRMEEGKPFPVICRRKASLQEEFLSYNAPSAGFDLSTGKRIEQKLLDYNVEAESFGGYFYEERSEVSPDHRFIAYTMHDKEKDAFILSVRDLATGALLDKPKAGQVANLSWAMNGQALLYTVTNSDRRPHRIFCSMLGSSTDDILILEESDENSYVNIRNTKDFQFITVNVSSSTASKVYLINAAEPLTGMTLVWECEPNSTCIIEHHHKMLYLFTNAAKGGVPVDSHYLLCSKKDTSGYGEWKNVILEEPAVSLVDVDFCDTHMVLVLKEGKNYRLCSVTLPLSIKVPVHLEDLHPYILPLPDHVCQIQSGPNYDYYSSIMRFIISSPVMPDAVVDYNLLNGTLNIVQQQNVLLERTKALYGFASSETMNSRTSKSFYDTDECDGSDGIWNDLSEFYACDYYNVSSEDGAMVPLTVVYSRKHTQVDSPGLLHGHGAYGEILDKRWRSELKSLLDRGWVVAYADVRGSGGYGRKWHHSGISLKKQNSVVDYISCSDFLINEGIVHKNKLAGWGYSAGGLLVAAAINVRPELFRVAILKAPFLDPVSTLLHPILRLNPIDYKEFGFPLNLEDFLVIKSYSPYENIKKGALYPSVLVSLSLNTRFGVWGAAKWVARVRELTAYDPKRPVIINFTPFVIEDSKYLQIKELAMETAFLIKMVSDS